MIRVYKKHKKLDSENRDIRQKIVESLNLSHLEKAQQDKVIFGLMDIVASRVNMVIWKKLTKEDKDHLKKVSKSGDAKVLDFLSSKTENFPKLVEDVTRQTVNDFRKKRSEVIKQQV